MLMLTEELARIMLLNTPADVIHPMSKEKIGSLSLRYVLLNYLKMQDGHPLIAEVHQADIAQNTHIIIPNTSDLKGC